MCKKVKTVKASQSPSYVDYFELLNSESLVKESQFELFIFSTETCLLSRFSSDACLLPWLLSSEREVKHFKTSLIQSEEERQN